MSLAKLMIHQVAALYRHLISARCGGIRTLQGLFNCSLGVASSAMMSSTTRMGICSNFVTALKDGTERCRDVAVRLGECLAKTMGRCCFCSTCLPTANAIGHCLGKVLVVLVLVVCFPCTCCWCICKGIQCFRRRRRQSRDSINEDGDRSRNGYRTFHDDNIQEEALHGEIRNYNFYRNQLKSEPDGDYIDVILEQWYGNYNLLENHHGFIQWLFPLYEPGVNWRAQVLNDNEVKLIMENREVYQRLLKSYKLMLDFYGIILVNEETGELQRSPLYHERFENLNRNRHNCLRISRILKCLRIFHYDHLAKPFVKFLVTEIVKEGNLPKCRQSCMQFWIPCLGEEDAEELNLYALELERAVKDGREKEEKGEEDLSNIHLV